VRWLESASVSICLWHSLRFTSPYLFFQVVEAVMKATAAKQAEGARGSKKKLDYASFALALQDS